MLRAHPEGPSVKFWTNVMPYRFIFIFVCEVARDSTETQSGGWRDDGALDGAKFDSLKEGTDIEHATHTRHDEKFKNK